MSKKLLTTAQVAKYLQTSEYTTRLWARERKIPCFKLGREWRFDLREVLKSIKIQTALKEGKRF